MSGRLIRLVRGDTGGRAVISTSLTLVLTRGAMVIAAVITARPLGPSGKGVVTAVFTWSQILTWFAIGGLNTASSVRVASRHSAARAAIGNAVSYAIVTGSLVAGIAAFVLPGALARLAPDARLLVYWSLATVPVAVLTEILVVVQLALGRHARYNLCRAALPIVLLGVSIVGVVSDKMTAGLYVAGIVAGTGVSALVASYGLPWRRALFFLPRLFEDLRFGLKLHLGNLMTFANARLDVLLMSLFLASSQIGSYSLANNMMAPLDIAAGGLTVLIAPAVARLARQASGDIHAQVCRVRSDALRGGAWALAAAVVVGASVHFLVPFVFGRAFSGAVVLIWILLPGYVFKSYAGVLVSGVAGMRLGWGPTIIESGGIAVTVILLPILLYKYGAVGAAITSTIAYTASAATGALLLRRVLVRHDAREDERKVPSSEVAHVA